MAKRIDTEHKIIFVVLLLVVFGLPFYLQANHVRPLDGNALMTAAGTVSGSGSQQPAPQTSAPINTLGQTAGRSFAGSNL